MYAKTPTIRRVARILEVSQGTVKRAIELALVVNADEDLSEIADGDLTHQVLLLADRQFRVDPPPC